MGILITKNSLWLQWRLQSEENLVSLPLPQQISPSMVVKCCYKMAALQRSLWCFILRDERQNLSNSWRWKRHTHTHIWLYYIAFYIHLSHWSRDNEKSCHGVKIYVTSWAHISSDIHMCCKRKCTVTERHAIRAFTPTPTNGRFRSSTLKHKHLTQSSFHCHW